MSSCKAAALQSSMLQSHYLGRVPFDDTYRLQRQLWQQRVAGEIPDQLLLLEHNPVITLGSGFKPEHLRVRPERLRELGVEVRQTDRGGDVTYHGPGQLVGYFILDLKPDRMDVSRYLRDIERIINLTLQEYSISARQRPGFTGVWVQDRKIASIGVKISRWVTYHGFALNVNTDLSYFDLMVPCGIQNVKMTSIERETGRQHDLRAVADTMSRNAQAVFAPHSYHSTAPEGNSSVTLKEAD
ncbi:MAG: lipoyl(octanoyl) transferase LipB [bacterium]